MVEREDGILEPKERGGGGSDKKAAGGIKVKVLEVTSFTSSRANNGEAFCTNNHNFEELSQCTTTVLKA